jgi:AcrR family transcriptional regulator
MSDKAAKKKQYILDTARGVFAKKGFKNVTMKDIVDACDISRGGLYIYFESTEDIFAELMKNEAEEMDDVFSGSINEESSAGDILALFLKEQKKELLSEKESLLVATYEYAFSNMNNSDRTELFKERLNAFVKVVRKLIEKGSESGELYCEDPEGAARNILNVIEGLKIRSVTTGITESDIDRELLYIMSGLIAD